MNDDLYSERELLAVNAYLDGEATPDERALVDSSPELLALVDEWRELREQTASVEVPSAARESALAAALAAFDNAHASLNPPAANVVRLERRQRQYRFLVGAAAAVAIVFGGLVVVQGGLGGSDHDDASSATFEAPAETEAPAAAEPMIAMDAPADEAATRMESEAGDTFSQPPAPAAAPEATESPAASAAPADTEGPTEIGDGSGSGSDPDALPRIDREDQLVAYYSANRSVVPTTAPAATTADAAPCMAGPDLVVGKVDFRGTPALVVISNDGEVLKAIDASTCIVLLTTTP